MVRYETLALHGSLILRWELDRVRRTADNENMIIRGRVQNGKVVLEGGHALPEGASVSVWCPVPGESKRGVEERRIQVPLVHCEEPGSVDLTGERIAEILNEEDASSRR